MSGTYRLRRAEEAKEFQADDVARAHHTATSAAVECGWDLLPVSVTVHLPANEALRALNSEFLLAVRGTKIDLAALALGDIQQNVRAIQVDIRNGKESVFTRSHVRNSPLYGPLMAEINWYVCNFGHMSLLRGELDDQAIENNWTWSEQDVRRHVDFLSGIPLDMAALTSAVNAEMAQVVQALQTAVNNSLLHEPRLIRHCNAALACTTARCGCAAIYARCSTP